MNSIRRTPDAPLEKRLQMDLEFRDVEVTDSYSMMRGRAVPYGEWATIASLFVESFAPESLAKSINRAADRRLRQGSGLPLNLFHKNDWFPIGHANEWTEERDGLWGVWRLDGSEMAQEAARHADEGRLTGLSIEFAPEISEWQEAEFWNPAAGADFMDKVTRRQARLGAVGLVQTPAYVSAGVEVVRSAEGRKRERVAGTPVLDAMKRATDALRNG